jgi:hypothetical protein
VCVTRGMARSSLAVGCAETDDYNDYRNSVRWRYE